MTQRRSVVSLLSFVIYTAFFDSLFFFFFNDTATTEIYTLSLHDALPISFPQPRPTPLAKPFPARARQHAQALAVLRRRQLARSEEHTSELQSRSDLVCRLLLEKKKKKKEQACTYGVLSHRRHNQSSLVTP